MPLQDQHHRYESKQWHCVEERTEELSGEEIADLPDVVQLVKRIAGGMVLEVIERQLQYLLEDVQVQTAIDSGGRDLSQESPCMADDHLGHDHHENRGDDDIQCWVGVVDDHLIDHHP